MKRFFLFLVLSSFCLGATAQDLSELYEKVNPAVVVIMSEAKDIAMQEGQVRKVSNVGLGSGFLISENQVVTAAHVVTVAEQIQIQFTDGEIIPAKVVSSYKTADVALLKLSWAKLLLQVHPL